MHVLHSTRLPAKLGLSLQQPRSRRAAKREDDSVSAQKPRTSHVFQSYEVIDSYDP